MVLGQPFGVQHRVKPDDLATSGVQGDEPVEHPQELLGRWSSRQRLSP